MSESQTARSSESLKAPEVHNEGGTELGSVGWEDVHLPLYFLWSGVCSLSVDGLLHPLELLKIRFQVQGNVRSSLFPSIFLLSFFC